MRNRIINIKKDVGFALNIPDIFENKQTKMSEILDTITFLTFPVCF